MAHLLEKKQSYWFEQGKRNLCITLFYSYRDFIVLRPGRQEGLLMLNLKCLTIVILIILLPFSFWR